MARLNVGNVGHCEVNANGIVKDEWNMTVSAPDIVAVVRCRDCKHFDTDGCPIPAGGVVNVNGYCDRGERKCDR